MANDGYYSIPNKRIVLSAATDILVRTPEGEERLWGDRWDHLDAMTLVVYRGDQVLQTYTQGEWPGGCTWNWEASPDVYEIWPEGVSNGV